jgi:uncharacterized protein (DUF1778 family)
MQHSSPDAHGTLARRTMINIRARSEDRALIDQAASLRGKSRSDFMLEASLRAAEDTLLDRTLLRVDPETFGLFLERLDAPPRPNAALRGLLATKAPWE